MFVYGARGETTILKETEAFVSAIVVAAYGTETDEDPWIQGGQTQAQDFSGE